MTPSTTSPLPARTSSTGASRRRVLILTVLVASCSASREIDPRGGHASASLPADDGSSDDNASQTVPSIRVEAVDEDIGPGAQWGGHCEVDADCVRVEEGCCPAGEHIALPKDEVDAYQASLHCEAVSCPLMMVVDDGSVAQCDGLTHTCEVVKPWAIQCGGFTTNPHSCPDGWRCRLPEHIADVPGECVEMCGGFAGLRCSNPKDLCVDDPDDSCDPAAGGADCGGICVPG